MALFTMQEHAMYRKYYGRKDLLEDEVFWADVMVTYFEHAFPIPYAYDFHTFRKISAMFSCQNCGMCCTYDRVHVSEEDIERIAKGVPDKCLGIYGQDQKGKYIARDTATKRCPYQVEAESGKWVCSIYEHRPTTCMLYPIVGRQSAAISGKDVDIILYRIKCYETVRVLRELMREHCQKADAILLPDMQTLKLESGGLPDISAKEFKEKHADTKS